jgi:hypothetical protein
MMESPHSIIQSGPGGSGSRAKAKNPAPDSSDSVNPSETVSGSLDGRKEEVSLEVSTDIDDIFAIFEMLFEPWDHHPSDAMQAGSPSSEVQRSNHPPFPFSERKMKGSLIHPLTPSEEEIGTVRFEVEQKIGKRIHRQTAYLIAVIVRLLEEHAQYGKLTVRQVYYQLVSRGVIENSENSYRNYDHHLTTGRKAGVIPWDAFEDRARMFYRQPSPGYDILNESDPEEALKGWFSYALNSRVSKEYDLHKWWGQPIYVELWVEKDALAGFLSPLCETLGVALIVSRGYTSYTFKQEAKKRFSEVVEDGRAPVLLYLGDLDPSGYDIYRCLKEEIDIATVERIGLHPDDVVQFGLVPNKGKESDCRTNGFKILFPELGDNVYELDALPPGELTDRARRWIKKYFDLSIEEENQRTVRHWRANFIDHQRQYRKLLADAGIDLEN